MRVAPNHALRCAAWERAPAGIGSTGSLPLCPYIIPNTKEQIPQPETAMGQCYGSDTNSYHENDFRMVHDI